MHINKLTSFSLLWMTLLLFPVESFTQGDSQSALADVVKGQAFRSIGPAVMGGRIADIAVSSLDPSTWYVAAGSGNLWKTRNKGITWQAVFEDQAAYSIGAVCLDPRNPELVWVGTGENVSGRHVGWGNGVYRSRDGGETWQHMGLDHSEHIGKILVDPRNSDVILVAAEGPLWAGGGDRGVYRSQDGGESWEQVLHIGEHTGVTDLEFDPANPDLVYAAAYQRRRHTWGFLAGGPQSGIYKSADLGQTWRKLSTGLPQGDMGKIGLAVSPADPQIVYATIEAQAQEKGLYRSLNRGESWEKRSDYISDGTGPHYYQEIYASPEDPERIYQMDVFLHVSRDGGKHFDYLETGREKHSDNHAFWIDPRDGNHLLAGTDGGLYESFDEGAHWRHFPNLPIAQFYKLGLDNSEPFYNIVGGAQDLGTLIGPSRTMTVEGVRNQDWYVPLGADGYHSVFDPEDPHIVYMEYQQGVLHRVDRRSQETLNIQPQPEPGDEPERWNWDSPILISPHDHRRLYVGSQRLWRSDDQGNAWQAISPDLTTNTNRYELEMMGRVWSIDALYDNGAMSKYATLTTLTESPLAEGVLYTGSDDGLIQVSEDGGDNWRKAGALPQVPVRSFINDVEASHHDPNTVFAVADAHKLGDFSPYLFMSTDRGKSWQSIAGDLPAGTIVWAIKQDHLAENLLFIGTEFGLYFSPDKGESWIKLEAGVPTIAFRDLALHQRDNDLVGATFGRGFYVLDDYSYLREISQAVEAASPRLFAVRDAWWYVPSLPMQAKGMPSQGSTHFAGKNPPFGALITYYVPELPKTGQEERQETEQALREQGADVPVPDWESLRAESQEGSVQVLLQIKDKQGKPIRWITGASKAGLHRVSWDLRHAPPHAIDLSSPAFKAPWVSDPVGPLVVPGEYQVELYVVEQGKLLAQGNPQTFIVKPVPSMSSDTDFLAVAEFQAETWELRRQLSGASKKLSEAGERLRYLGAALKQTPRANAEHMASHQSLSKRLSELQLRLSGDPIRQAKNEPSLPSISGRVSQVSNGHWKTLQAPTQTWIHTLEVADKEFAVFQQELTLYLQDLEAYESALEEAGAPYTRGRRN